MVVDFLPFCFRDLDRFVPTLVVTRMLVHQLIKIKVKIWLEIQIMDGNMVVTIMVVDGIKLV